MHPLQVAPHMHHVCLAFFTSGPVQHRTLNQVTPCPTPCCEVLGCGIDGPWFERWRSRRWGILPSRKSWSQGEPEKGPRGSDGEMSHVTSNTCDNLVHVQLFFEMQGYRCHNLAFYRLCKAQAPLQSPSDLVVSST